MNQTIKFISTKEYKRFTEFCNACKKDRYIGLCYGAAGVGKSMAAYEFSHWNEVKNEIKKMESCKTSYTWPSIEMRDFDTIIYTPKVSNSPSAIFQSIRRIAYDFECLVEASTYKAQLNPDTERLMDERLRLLIIDEADRLQPKCFEQIRDIYDRQKIAVIFIGMPGIEKRLVRFPQLYSRVGFAHVYKPLSKEEIAFIIENHLAELNVTIDPTNFSDHEAIATFARITQGNFRLIDRLLKQTIRIMTLNQLSSVTKETIEAARECLIIGNG